MNVQANRLEKLGKRLHNSLSHPHLDAYRDAVDAACLEMGMELQDFAATLLLITHPHLLQPGNLNPPADKQPPRPPAPAVSDHRPKSTHVRNVRYRLDVGNQHGVSTEDILDLLVAESGVDRKRISKLEIRDHYSIVDLPDGMPADIFHLLSETILNGQRLNLKRVKGNRRPLPRPTRLPRNG